MHTFGIENFAARGDRGRLPRMDIVRADAGAANLPALKEEVERYKQIIRMSGDAAVVSRVMAIPEVHRNMRFGDGSVRDGVVYAIAEVRAVCDAKVRQVEANTDARVKDLRTRLAVANLAAFVLAGVTVGVSAVATWLALR
jgi:hypothetical protein